MKKVFVLVLMATALVACEKDELESVEETIITMREQEKSKEEQPKQTTDWKLLNSKIIGAKDDAPQGKQSDYSKNKEN